MQDINNAKQESSVQNSKRLFAIFWTETVEYVAEVKAKTEKEARELFYKDNIQILGSTECLDNRKNSRPSIMEVSE
ncbi:MAG: hypothetical protein ACYSR9_09350 [Planctomycetota bacterium]|jgi:hypothetical protein